MAGHSRGFTVEVRGARSRWTCELEGCGETGTTRGGQPDDITAMQASSHQQEAHHEALIGEAIAVLADAQEAVRLLSGVITDADTTTYWGDACVTPEAAQAALDTWKNQLTGMLREPPEGKARWNWRWACDHGRRTACQHDTRRPVPTLGLEMMKMA